MPDDKHKFKPGQIVMLRSEAERPDGDVTYMTVGFVDHDAINCVWFSDDRVMHWGRIPGPALLIYEDIGDDEWAQAEEIQADEDQV